MDDDTVDCNLEGDQYSTVEFIELTSAVPFTLAQLKEFTLARGFIPSLHGATTLP
eukprot:COSAG01_NODE_15025_length_1383_cov_55.083333_1_plen_54_part_10